MSDGGTQWESFGRKGGGGGFERREAKGCLAFGDETYGTMLGPARRSGYQLDTVSVIGKERD